MDAAAKSPPPPRHSTRRRSSSRTEEIQPSTSSSTSQHMPDNEDVLMSMVSELAGRILSQVRTTRDETRTSLLVGLVSSSESSRRTEEDDDHEHAFPDYSEDAESLLVQRMQPMDVGIAELEKKLTGTNLEVLLKSPRYSSPIRPPKSPEKQNTLIAGVEAKGDDCSAQMPAAPTQSKTFSPLKAERQRVNERPPHHATPGSSSAQLLSVNTLHAPQERDIEGAVKREAETMARIAELRRAGLWTPSQLPLIVEPPRNKTHWDFVLEEVKWMAADFRQERIFKRQAAKKFSHAIARQHREKELEKARVDQRAVREQRRGAGVIAKMVRDFWQNVDKVVDHRAQKIIESKKRKALDQHLAFIVGEADKLSSIVQEGLQETPPRRATSKTPSIAATDKEDFNDKDFAGDDSDESDDERTIARAEKKAKGEDVAGEVSALEKESMLEIDDLLDSLPPDYLASLGYAVAGRSGTSTSKQAKQDEEEEEEDMTDEESEEEGESEEETEKKEEKALSSPPSKRKRVEETASEAVEEEDMDDIPLIKLLTPRPDSTAPSTSRGEAPSNEEEESDDEPLAKKIRSSMPRDSSWISQSAPIKENPLGGAAGERDENASARRSSSTATITREEEGSKTPRPDSTAPSTSRGEAPSNEEEESDDEPLAKKIRSSMPRDSSWISQSAPIKENPLGGAAGERDENASARRSSSTATITREEEGSKEQSTSREGEEEPEEDAEASKILGGNVDMRKLHSHNSDERQQELTNIAEEALKFQPKGFTLETTQVKTVVPFLIRGQLREYQMVGLDWLVTLYEKNLNGILADEMGLGKTIQTVALLAHLACTESIWGPHLVVVPTSVMLNWEMEFKKWCPALKILTYFGSVKDRFEKRKGWMKDNSFHVCITSYKVITQDIRSFKKKAWQYFILDEAQNIKNFKSQRWRMLLNVRARRRLLLTGTPLQNSLMELWSLLHFLMPAIFASHDDFKDWFSNPLTGMMEGAVEFNSGLVQRLHKVLRPFILRRLKADVEKQLPEKTEHIIKCPLSKRQRFLYDDYMTLRDTRENLRSGNMVSVLNIVMQLRKCCNHPNLFAPREEQTPFVVTPIRKQLPAMVFDVVGETARDEKARMEVPACFDLRRRFVGWRSQVKSEKPLIEVLQNWEDPIQPPRVPGFNFSRPVFDRNAPSQRLPAGGGVVGKPPGSATRTGHYHGGKVGPPVTTTGPFGHNDMFLVVNDDDDLEGLIRNQGSAPLSMQVRVDGGRAVLDSAGGRACQIVTGEGGVKTIRVMPSTNSSEQAGKEGESRDGGEAGSSSSDSARRMSTSIYARGRTAANTLTPIRSTTVVHPLKVRTNGHSAEAGGSGIPSPSTAAVGGVGARRSLHASLAEEAECSSLNKYAMQLSPPMKRRRPVLKSLVSGPFKEIVSEAELRRLEEEARDRLERARDRFGRSQEPIFSLQLVSLLYREAHSTRRRRIANSTEQRWQHDPWAAEKRSDIRVLLEDEMRRAAKQFTIYVDGAYAEQPSVLPTSRGRSAWSRAATAQVAEDARSFLSKYDPLVDASLLSHRIQFPELRLIEYDCGKLQILAKLLRELHTYKHRCLIFTQMSRMLDVLQAFLSHHGYQYFRLDGTTPIESRQCMMERFNADPRIFCFILSTRSGGVGVNLTGADTVIFYDSDWNPTMDAQAQDRCHRIGQTRNVSIYRLISERTIEENILKKAMQKKRLGEMAIDEAGFTPDFFKQSDNIRDLFEGENIGEDEVTAPMDAPKDQRELEKAMASLEDEQDVVAAKRVVSEASADQREFDERAPVVAVGGHSNTTVATNSAKEEPMDEQYMELLSALKPIERYAITFLEAEYKPDFEEEVKEAEALIEQKREEWAKRHEKAIRDEEALLNEDGEPLSDSEGHDPFVGSNGTADEEVHEESHDVQLFADFDIVFEDLCYIPTWMPPTPPLSDTENDLHVDDIFDRFYEPELMPESRLPANIHDLVRPLAKYQPAPAPMTHMQYTHGQSPVKGYREQQTLAPQLNVNSVSSSTGSSGQKPGFEGFQQNMMRDADSLSRDAPSPSLAPHPARADAAPVSSMLPPPGYPSRMNIDPLPGHPNATVREVLQHQHNSSGPLHQAVGGGGVGGITAAHAALLAAELATRKASATQRQHAGRSRAESKRPTTKATTPPPPDREAKDYEGPEWTIVEDYALLQAVMSEQRLTHMEPSRRSGCKLNWEFVAGFVNRVTGFYRSPRQCSVHYQMVVLPREEGRLHAIDPVTKKNRKLLLCQHEIRHLQSGRQTTSQQYDYEVTSLVNERAVDRIAILNRVATARVPPFKRQQHPTIRLSSGATPVADHHRRLSELLSGCPIPLLETPEKLAGYREERRVSQQQQDASRQREATTLPDDKLYNVAVVRPSAVNHKAGQPLTVPTSLFVDIPAISRPVVSVPSTTSHHSSIHTSNSEPMLRHPAGDHLSAVASGPLRRVPSSQHMLMSGGQGTGQSGPSPSSERYSMAKRAGGVPVASSTGQYVVVAASDSGMPGGGGGGAVGSQRVTATFVARGGSEGSCQQAGQMVGTLVPASSMQGGAAQSPPAVYRNLSASGMQKRTASPAQSRMPVNYVSLPVSQASSMGAQSRMPVNYVSLPVSQASSMGGGQQMAVDGSSSMGQGTHLQVVRGPPPPGPPRDPRGQQQRLPPRASFANRTLYTVATTSAGIPPGSALAISSATPSSGAMPPGGNDGATYAMSSSGAAVVASSAPVTTVGGGSAGGGGGGPGSYVASGGAPTRTYVVPQSSLRMVPHPAASTISSGGGGSGIAAGPPTRLPPKRALPGKPPAGSTLVMPRSMQQHLRPPMGRYPPGMSNTGGGVGPGGPVGSPIGGPGGSGPGAPRGFSIVMRGGEGGAQRVIAAGGGQQTAGSMARQILAAGIPRPNPPPPRQPHHLQQQHHYQQQQLNHPGGDSSGAAPELIPMSAAGALPPISAPNSNSMSQPICSYQQHHQPPP